MPDTQLKPAYYVWGQCAHDAETFYVGFATDDTGPIFKLCECVSDDAAQDIAEALALYKLDDIFECGRRDGGEK